MALARQPDPQQTPLRLLTYTESLRQRLNPVISVPQPAAAQVASVSREQAPADATARLDDEDCGGEWVRWRVGGSACAEGGAPDSRMEWRTEAATRPDMPLGGDY